MVSKKSTQEVRIGMPAHGNSAEVVDEVALYGFRSTDKSLWYLSPWEFVQWVKPHRLRPPSKDYTWTKWTPAGRKKQRESMGEKVAYKPYEDYILNEKEVAKCAFLFPYLPGHKVYKAPIPETYQE